MSHRIWLIGDSITYQYGGFFKDQWETANPGDVVTVLGVGGEKSIGGSARGKQLLAAAPPEEKPTIVVMSWGTNDCVTLIDPDDAQQDIHPCVTALTITDLAVTFRDAGVFPLVGLPIGFPLVSTVGNQELLDRLNGWTSEQRILLRQELRKVEIKFFPMPRQDDTSFWADAFHPTWANAETIVAPGVASALTAKMPQ